MFDALTDQEMHMLKHKLSSGYWRMIGIYELRVPTNLNTAMWEMAADIHDTFKWVSHRKGRVK